ncbi:MAG: molybdopterin-dependent oxidoreductase [Syntrophothermus sp.]
MPTRLRRGPSSLKTSPAVRVTSRRGGRGGLRRISWEEALEIVAASTIYTIKKYGPDRVIGFSPIPAMSMVSFAGGSRFLQLLGGVNLSFYDWYCDLPNASPRSGENRRMWRRVRTGSTASILWPWVPTSV